MVQGLEKKRQKVESRGRMIAETSVKKVKEENTTIAVSQENQILFYKTANVKKGMKTKYFVLMDVLSDNFFFLVGGNSSLHYNGKRFF